MQQSDAEIAAHLKRILQSDEFRSRASDRAFSRLIAFLRDLFRLLTVSSWPIRLALIVLSSLILMTIAVRLWRAYREVVRPISLRDGIASRRERAPLSPEALVAQARSLADAGLIRDAARALQQALLVETCRKGNIPWRPSLSDWEWVTILRPSDRVIAFTRATQRLAFGPEPSRATFDACAHEMDAMIAPAGQQESERS